MDRVSWLSEGIASGIPAVASSLLFVGYGAAAAWLLGLRSPLLAVVAALPSGIGLLVLTSHVLGMVGVRASLLMHGFAALGAAALVAAGRRRWKQGIEVERPATQGPPRLVWAGAGIGAVVAAGVWLGGIGNFQLPPQGTDDIWHGYLVERLTHMPFITADTVAPGFVDRADPVIFYQYGLHLAGAFIHELTGVAVPEILNGAWVVWVGFLLPVGVAGAAWRLFPNRPWVAFWSGSLSSGVAVFPYVTNGILPYTAALAMIPGLLALGVAFVQDQLRVPSFVLALSALGVFITHPAGAIAAAVLAALVAIEQVLRGVSATEPRLRTLRRLVIAAGLAAFVSLPWVLAAGDVGVATLETPPATVTSTPGSAVLPAAWMLLGLASPWTPPQPLLAFLAATGIVISILSRRALAIATGALIFGLMFVGVVVGSSGAAELAGPWNGDWYRLVAVVGLLTPILAGLGATSIIECSTQLTKRIAESRASVTRVGMTVVLASVAGVATAYDAAHAQSIVRSSWHSSGLLTAEDVQVLEDLADRLSPTDKVLNSPVDGSTWMYAMFEATPILPYPAGSTLHLPDLFRGEGMYGDPRVVCTTLAGTGATFAVVKDVRGGSNDYDIAGFVGRNPSLFKEVLRDGGTAAFRIDQVALARCAEG